MFNSTVLSRHESDIVLESIIGFLADGQTLIRSLLFTAEILGKKNPKIEKVIKLVEHDVTEDSIPMSEALFLHGIFTEEEATLFTEQSGKTRDSILNIMQLREYGNEYEKILWSAIKGTYYFFIFVCLTAFFFVDELVERLSQTFKDTVTMEVQTIDQIDIFPFWMENKWTLIYLLIAVIGLKYFIQYVYKYYYKNDRRIIYKIFGKKAYDDIPRLFQIMSDMKKSARYNTITIFEAMGESKSYRGLQNMFNNLYEAALHKDELNIVFDDANFPKDVVVLIRVKEETDFWDGIESLIRFAKNRAATEYGKLKEYVSYANWVLPWLFPTYILMSLSFSFMKAMNIG